MAIKKRQNSPVTEYSRSRRAFRQLKQKQKFPVSMGIIMFPFLLASIVGIIVFGFNILSVNNKAQAANNLPVAAQNMGAQADTTARMNPISAVAAANPVSQNETNAASAESVPSRLNFTSSTDPVPRRLSVEPAKAEPVKVEPVKAEPAKIEPVKAEPVKAEPAKTVATRTAAVPVGGAQTQSSPTPTREQAARDTARNTPARATAQNWSIQAGAFSIESSAIQIRDKITPLGYAAVITRTGTDRPLFKVMVSPGNSRDAPNEALRRLSLIGVEGFIVRGRS